MSALYIGLMSGTSTDGIDGVLAGFAPRARILAHASAPLPQALRAQLLALNVPGENELARAALAANALADCQAELVAALLKSAALAPEAVAAIGSHGQTVRHAPENSYTIQLNAPARLAERCKIAVVADFRSRDVAAGGQGAPLVPAFHAACFGGQGGPGDPVRAVLNLGGIANLTVLAEPVRGFDTGPANMLLDAWAQLHLGRSFDAGGAWAASGRLQPGLLAALLAEPWLGLAPPKSTGRDLFNLNWLRQILAAPEFAALAPADVQASLLEFSARSVAAAVRAYAPEVGELIACGGGVRNQALMRALARALPCALSRSAAYGVDEQLVEALAFAWLAQAHLEGVPACLPSVTGARHATIAGCLYPA